MRQVQVTRSWGRLEKLGYATYADYLASPAWKSKRLTALARDLHRCKCGAKARQVHHLTYERIGEEALTDLVSICDGCHRKEHGIGRNPTKRKKKGPATTPSKKKKGNKFKKGYTAPAGALRADIAAMKARNAARARDEANARSLRTAPNSPDGAPGSRPGSARSTDA